MRARAYLWRWGRCGDLLLCLARPPVCVIFVWCCRTSPLSLHGSPFPLPRIISAHMRLSSRMVADGVCEQMNIYIYICVSSVFLLPPPPECASPSSPGGSSCSPRRLFIHCRLLTDQACAPHARRIYCAAPHARKGMRRREETRKENVQNAPWAAAARLAADGSDGGARSAGAPPCLRMAGIGVWQKE